MDLGLTGKTAIVTGASKGIGKAIAQTLAAEGANVMVAARNAAEVEAVAAGIRAAGGQAEGLATDITVPEQIDALVRRAVERFGGIHILVNNAGSQRRKLNFDDLTDQDFMECYEDNVLSVVRAVRACLPHMRAQQWGRIINIGSEVAKQPERTFPHYNAAKAAQWNLTKTLSKMLGRENILVNSVAPGIIETPGVIASFEAGARKQGRPEQELRDDFFRKFKPNQVIKRGGTPEEIAGMVAFLASDWASFITGANHAIDGGQVGAL